MTTIIGQYRVLYCTVLASLLYGVPRRVTQRTRYAERALILARSVLLFSLFSCACCVCCVTRAFGASKGLSRNREQLSQRRVVPWRRPLPHPRRLKRRSGSRISRRRRKGKRRSSSMAAAASAWRRRFLSARRWKCTAGCWTSTQGVPAVQVAAGPNRDVVVCV